MPHIPLKVTLLNITERPGELVEQCAAMSYVTQRFFDRVHPAHVVFKSGRTIPLSELKLDHVPVQGEVVPGFVKDDKFVYKYEPASWENVVRFLRKLGHWKLFCMPMATFKLEGISRKSALHFIRYEFLVTNFQSQKYQPQDSFNYVLPSPGEEDPQDVAKLEAALKQIQSIYEDLRNTKLDPEWARGVYPNIIGQTMTISTNFLQWEHICKTLLPEVYVSENRRIAVEIIKQLKEKAPVFFEGFVESESGEWKIPPYNRNLTVNAGIGNSEKRKLNIPVFDDDVLI